MQIEIMEPLPADQAIPVSCREKMNQFYERNRIGLHTLNSLIMDAGLIYSIAMRSSGAMYAGVLGVLAPFYLNSAVHMYDYRVENETVNVSWKRLVVLSIYSAVCFYSGIALLDASTKVAKMVTPILFSLGVLPSGLFIGSSKGRRAFQNF